MIGRPDRRYALFGYSPPPYATITFPADAHRASRQSPDGPEGDAVKQRAKGAATPFIRRLEQFGRFSANEKAAVEAAVDVAPHHTARARVDIISEGDPPRGLVLVTSGWACRHKTLADGRRQIVALLVPGDLCDLNNQMLVRMDHAIGTLTPVSYVELPHRAVEALMTDHPSLSVTLWKQLLVTLALQREWTANIGQRSALERLAHLFCELSLRLRAVGMADQTGYEFPLTQADLADASGLTAVHVNRTLQQLRAEGLITLGGRVLTIPSFARLAEAAQFTADYLHIGTGDRSAAWHVPRVGALL